MRTRRDTGGVLVLVAVSMTVLLGIAALAIDTGNFRAHRRQMQTAADAGALAGAAQLIRNANGICGAGGFADTYERQNTNLTDSKNLIKNSNLDTSYCEILGNSAVRVKPVESSVPYIFGRVLGFFNTSIDARARARIVYLTTARGLMPFGVEDLRPQSVRILVGGNPAISLGSSGCSPATTTEGFPFWCGGGYVNSLPAGGAPVSVEVTDSSGKIVSWSNIGWVGTDYPLAGCTGCVVKAVSLNPVADPYIYYTSSSSPKNFDVQASVQNVPSGFSVQVSVNGSNFQNMSTSGSNCATSTCTYLDTGYTSSSSAGAEPIQIRLKNGKTTFGPVTVQQAQARDDGDILQQYTSSTHYVAASAAANTAGRFVNFTSAFQVFVRGREIVLKLGGGGAGGNSGNFGSLDLDTNTSWPQYRCYPGSTPNLADEVEHGSCTPYSLGQNVATQTGNAAGQIEHGLDNRINGSPAVKPFSTTNPPPPGDPRWINLILVPPLVFGGCTGNCTTQVVGFGNFYITEYSGDRGSKLKNGEVKGAFWDRANPSGAYSTTCTSPDGICLESIALVPWNG